jgi:ADP-ribose pyrophosphatase YjhB (NUDIX family)
MSAVPVARVGARVVLLDDADRVLLIEEGGDEPGNRWRHWLTPGGGVEADEALSAAAVREVLEETGLRVYLSPDAAPFHTQRRQWAWRGVRYDQVDNYFAARVSRAFEVSPAAPTEMELETVIGARWWTLDELAADRHSTFVPPDIADVARRAAADPAVPRPAFRPAGRALVVDPMGAVLLMNIRPDLEAAGSNWITPGGGCDDGESPAGAAARELAEETGIAADFGEQESVATEHAVFPFGGRLYDQVDHFFLLRVGERPDLDLSGLTEGERAMLLEFRWWTAAELRARADVVWPADLSDILDRITS